MIKPDQIVIAAALMHPLLINRLDENTKLPIRVSDLAARIDIMANEELIIPLGEQSLVNTGSTLAVPLGLLQGLLYEVA
jgi:dUTPase